MMKNNETPITGQHDNTPARLTGEQFLKEFSVPVIQQRCRAIDTPAKIFTANLPSITAIKTSYGEVFAQAYIETWIVNLCEFVNIGKNMNPSQCFYTAGMIMDEYWYLTIADINLVFKRAKMGIYGQIFDRLDGQVILGWFNAYNNERMYAAEEDSINEANRKRERDNRNRKYETTTIDSSLPPKKK